MKNSSKIGNINFFVSGYVNQEFTVVSDNITVEDVINKLKNGEAVTTLATNGDIIELPSCKVLAKINSIETINAEYVEFDDDIF